ncbi:Fibronectin type III [Trinorchestia longiramus]|nr:Fibronectin type III [Trinorchestia longiramus]
MSQNWSHLRDQVCLNQSKVKETSALNSRIAASVKDIQDEETQPLSIVPLTPKTPATAEDEQPSVEAKPTLSYLQRQVLKKRLDAKMFEETKMSERMEGSLALHEEEESMIKQKKIIKEKKKKKDSKVTKTVTEEEEIEEELSESEAETPLDEDTKTEIVREFSPVQKTNLLIFSLASRRKETTTTKKKLGKVIKKKTVVSTEEEESLDLNERQLQNGDFGQEEFTEEFVPERKPKEVIKAEAVLTKNTALQNLEQVLGEKETNLKETYRTQEAKCITDVHESISVTDQTSHETISDLLPHEPKQMIALPDVRQQISLSITEVLAKEKESYLPEKTDKLAEATQVQSLHESVCVTDQHPHDSFSDLVQPKVNEMIAIPGVRQQEPLSITEIVTDDKEQRFIQKENKLAEATQIQNLQESVVVTDQPLHDSFSDLIQSKPNEMIAIPDVRQQESLSVTEIVIDDKEGIFTQKEDIYAEATQTQNLQESVIVSDQSLHDTFVELVELKPTEMIAIPDVRQQESLSVTEVIIDDKEGSFTKKKDNLAEATRIQSLQESVVVTDQPLHDTFAELVQVKPNEMIAIPDVRQQESLSVTEVIIDDKEENFTKKENKLAEATKVQSLQESVVITDQHLHDTIGDLIQSKPNEMIAIPDVRQQESLSVTEVIIDDKEADFTKKQEKLAEATQIQSLQESVIVTDQPLHDTVVNLIQPKPNEMFAIPDVKQQESVTVTEIVIDEKEEDLASRINKIAEATTSHNLHESVNITQESIQDSVSELTQMKPDTKIAIPDVRQQESLLVSETMTEEKESNLTIRADKKAEANTIHEMHESVTVFDQASHDTFSDLVQSKRNEMVAIPDVRQQESLSVTEVMLDDKEGSFVPHVGKTAAANTLHSLHDSVSITDHVAHEMFSDLIDKKPSMETAIPDVKQQESLLVTEILSDDKEEIFAAKTNQTAEATSSHNLHEAVCVTDQSSQEAFSEFTRGKPCEAKASPDVREQESLSVTEIMIDDKEEVLKKKVPKEGQANIKQPLQESVSVSLTQMMIKEGIEETKKEKMATATIGHTGTVSSLSVGETNLSESLGALKEAEHVSESGTRSYVEQSAAEVREVILSEREGGVHIEPQTADLATVLETALVSDHLNVLELQSVESTDALPEDTRPAAQKVAPNAQTQESILVSEIHDMVSEKEFQSKKFASTMASGAIEESLAIEIENPIIREEAKLVEGEKLLPSTTAQKSVAGFVSLGVSEVELFEGADVFKRDTPKTETAKTKSEQQQAVTVSETEAESTIDELVCEKPASTTVNPTTINNESVTVDVVSCEEKEGIIMKEEVTSGVCQEVNDIQQALLVKDYQELTLPADFISKKPVSDTANKGLVPQRAVEVEEQSIHMKEEEFSSKKTPGVTIQGDMTVNEAAVEVKETKAQSPVRELSKQQSVEKERASTEFVEQKSVSVSEVSTSHKEQLLKELLKVECKARRDLVLGLQSVQVSEEYFNINAPEFKEIKMKLENAKVNVKGLKAADVYEVIIQELEGLYNKENLEKSYPNKLIEEYTPLLIEEVEVTSPIEELPKPKEVQKEEVFPQFPSNTAIMVQETSAADKESIMKIDQTVSETATLGLSRGYDSLNVTEVKSSESSQDLKEMPVPDDRKATVKLADLQKAAITSSVLLNEKEELQKTTIFEKHIAERTIDAEQSLSVQETRSQSPVRDLQDLKMPKTEEGHIAYVPSVASMTSEITANEKESVSIETPALSLTLKSQLVPGENSVVVSETVAQDSVSKFSQMKPESYSATADFMPQQAAMGSDVTCVEAEKEYIPTKPFTDVASAELQIGQAPLEVTENRPQSSLGVFHSAIAVMGQAISNIIPKKAIEIYSTFTSEREGNVEESKPLSALVTPTLTGALVPIDVSEISTNVKEGKFTPIQPQEELASSDLIPYRAATMQETVVQDKESEHKEIKPIGVLANESRLAASQPIIISEVLADTDVPDRKETKVTPCESRQNIVSLDCVQVLMADVQEKEKLFKEKELVSTSANVDEEPNHPVALLSDVNTLDNVDCLTLTKTKEMTASMSMQGQQVAEVSEHYVQDSEAKMKIPVFDSTSAKQVIDESQSVSVFEVEAGQKEVVSEELPMPSSKKLEGIPVITPLYAPHIQFMQVTEQEGIKEDELVNVGQANPSITGQSVAQVASELKEGTFEGKQPVASMNAAPNVVLVPRISPNISSIVIGEQEGHAVTDSMEQRHARLTVDEQKVAGTSETLIHEKETSLHIIPDESMKANTVLFESQGLTVSEVFSDNKEEDYQESIAPDHHQSVSQPVIVPLHIAHVEEAEMKEREGRIRAADIQESEANVIFVGQESIQMSEALTIEKEETLDEKSPVKMSSAHPAMEEMQSIVISETVTESKEGIHPEDQFPESHVIKGKPVIVPMKLANVAELSTSDLEARMSIPALHEDHASSQLVTNLPVLATQPTVSCNTSEFETISDLTLKAKESIDKVYPLNVSKVEAHTKEGPLEKMMTPNEAYGREVSVLAPLIVPNIQQTDLIEHEGVCFGKAKPTATARLMVDEQHAAFVEQTFTGDREQILQQSTERSDKATCGISETHHLSVTEVTAETKETEAQFADLPVLQTAKSASVVSPLPVPSVMDTTVVESEGSIEALKGVPTTAAVALDAQIIALTTETQSTEKEQQLLLDKHKSSQAKLFVDEVQSLDVTEVQTNYKEKGFSSKSLGVEETAEAIPVVTPLRVPGHQYVDIVEKEGKMSDYETPSAQKLSEDTTIKPRHLPSVTQIFTSEREKQHLVSDIPRETAVPVLTEQEVVEVTEQMPIDETQKFETLMPDMKKPAEATVLSPRFVPNVSQTYITEHGIDAEIKAPATETAKVALSGQVIAETSEATIREKESRFDDKGQPTAVASKETVLLPMHVVASSVTFPSEQEGSSDGWKPNEEKAKILLDKREVLQVTQTITDDKEKEFVTSKESERSATALIDEMKSLSVSMVNIVETDNVFKETPQQTQQANSMLEGSQLVLPGVSTTLTSEETGILEKKVEAARSEAVANIAAQESLKISQVESHEKEVCMDKFIAQTVSAKRMIEESVALSVDVVEAENEREQIFFEKPADKQNVRAATVLQPMNVPSVHENIPEEKEIIELPHKMESHIASTSFKEQKNVLEVSQSEVLQSGKSFETPVLETSKAKLLLNELQPLQVSEITSGLREGVHEETHPKEEVLDAKDVLSPRQVATIIETDTAEKESQQSIISPDEVHAGVAVQESKCATVSEIPLNTKEGKLLIETPQTATLSSEHVIRPLNVANVGDTLISEMEGRTPDFKKSSTQARKILDESSSVLITEINVGENEQPTSADEPEKCTVEAKSVLVPRHLANVSDTEAIEKEFPVSGKKITDSSATVQLETHKHRETVEIQSMDTTEDVSLKSTKKETVNVVLEPASHITRIDQVVSENVSESDVLKPDIAHARTIFDERKPVSISHVDTFDQTGAVTDSGLPVPEVARRSQLPSDHITITEVMADQDSTLKSVAMKTATATTSLDAQKPVTVSTVTVEESYDETERPLPHKEKAQASPFLQEHIAVSETEVHETTGEIQQIKPVPESAKPLISEQEPLMISQISESETSGEITFAKPQQDSAKLAIGPQEALVVSETTSEEELTQKNLSVEKAKAKTARDQRQSVQVQETDILEEVKEMDAFLREELKPQIREGEDLNVPYISEVKSQIGESKPKKPERKRDLPKSKTESDLIEIGEVVTELLPATSEWDTAVASVTEGLLRAEQEDVIVLQAPKKMEKALEVLSEEPETAVVTVTKTKKTIKVQPEKIIEESLDDRGQKVEEKLPEETPSVAKIETVVEEEEKIKLPSKKPKKPKKETIIEETVLKDDHELSKIEEFDKPQVATVTEQTEESQVIKLRKKKPVKPKAEEFSEETLKEDVRKIIEKEPDAPLVADLSEVLQEKTEEKILLKKPKKKLVEEGKLEESSQKVSIQEPAQTESATFSEVIEEKVEIDHPKKKGKKPLKEDITQGRFEVTTDVLDERELEKPKSVQVETLVEEITDEVKPKKPKKVKKQVITEGTTEVELKRQESKELEQPQTAETEETQVLVKKVPKKKKLVPEEIIEETSSHTQSKITEEQMDQPQLSVIEMQETVAIPLKKSKKPKMEEATVGIVDAPLQIVEEAEQPKPMTSVLEDQEKPQQAKVEEHVEVKLPKKKSKKLEKEELVEETLSVPVKTRAKVELEKPETSVIEEEDVSFTLKKAKKDKIQVTEGKVDIPEKKKEDTTLEKPQTAFVEEDAVVQLPTKKKRKPKKEELLEGKLDDTSKLPEEFTPESPQVAQAEEQEVTVSLKKAKKQKPEKLSQEELEYTLSKPQLVEPLMPQPAVVEEPEEIKSTLKKDKKPRAQEIIDGKVEVLPQQQGVNEAPKPQSAVVEETISEVDTIEEEQVEIRLKPKKVKKMKSEELIQQTVDVSVERLEVNEPEKPQSSEIDEQVDIKLPKTKKPKPQELTEETVDFTMKKPGTKEPEKPQTSEIEEEVEVKLPSKKAKKPKPEEITEETVDFTMKKPGTKEPEKPQTSEIEEEVEVKLPSKKAKKAKPEEITEETVDFTMKKPGTKELEKPQTSEIEEEVEVKLPSKKVKKPKPEEITEETVDFTMKKPGTKEPEKPQTSEIEEEVEVKLPSKKAKKPKSEEITEETVDFTMKKPGTKEPEKPQTSEIEEEVEVKLPSKRAKKLKPEEITEETVDFTMKKPGTKEPEKPQTSEIEEEVEVKLPSKKAKKPKPEKITEETVDFTVKKPGMKEQEKPQTSEIEEEVEVKLPSKKAKKPKSEEITEETVDFTMKKPGTKEPEKPQTSEIEEEVEVKLPSKKAKKPKPEEITEETVDFTVKKPGTKEPEKPQTSEIDETVEVKLPSRKPKKKPDEVTQETVDITLKKVESTEAEKPQSSEIDEHVEVQLPKKSKKPKSEEIVEETLNVTIEKTEENVMEQPKKSEIEETHEEVILPSKKTKKPKLKKATEEKLDSTVKKAGEKEPDTPLIAESSVTDDSESVVLQRRPKPKQAAEVVDVEETVELEAQKPIQQVSEETVDIKIKKKKPKAYTSDSIDIEEEVTVRDETETKEIDEIQSISIKRKPKKKYSITEETETEFVVTKPELPTQEYSEPVPEVIKKKYQEIREDVSVQLKKPTDYTTEEMEEEVKIKMKKAPKRYSVSEETVHSEVLLQPESVDEEVEIHQTEETEKMESIVVSKPKKKKTVQEETETVSVQLRPKKKSLVTEEVEEEFTVRKSSIDEKPSVTDATFTLKKPEEVDKPHQEISEDVDVAVRRPSDFTSEETTEQVDIKLKKKPRTYVIDEETAEKKVIVPREDSEPEDIVVESVEEVTENVTIKAKPKKKVKDVKPKSKSPSPEKPEEFIVKRKKKPHKVEDQEIETQFTIKTDRRTSEDISEDVSLRLRSDRSDTSSEEDRTEKIEEVGGQFTFVKQPKQVKKKVSQESITAEVKIPQAPRRAPCIPQEDTGVAVSSSITIQAARANEVKVGDLLMAIATYVAEEEHENSMHLVEGEKVYVIENSDHDWWFVEKHLTKERGYVPSKMLSVEADYTLYVRKKLEEKINNLPVFEKLKKGQKAEVPKITLFLESQSVADGQEAQFVVKVQGTPRPNVTWFRQTAIIKPSEEFQVFYSDDNTATLLIKEVFPEDAGLFTCVVKNLAGYAISEAELIVEGPMSDHGSDTMLASRRSLSRDSSVCDTMEGIPPTFAMKTIRKTCEENAQFEVDVRLVAIPEPEIVWKKDGLILRDSNRIRIVRQKDVHAYRSIILIKGTKKDDEGEYQVYCKNREGEAKCSIFLTITAPEEPVFEELFGDTTVEELGTFRLVARIRGIPTPDITWSRNGKKIKLESNVIASYEDEVAVLEVQHATKSEAGKYVCTASNKMGKVSHSANVTVGSDVVTFKRGLDSCIVEENSQAVLECRTSKDKEVRWWKGKMELKTNERITLEHEGLTHRLIIHSSAVTDTGKYKCTFDDQTTWCNMTVKPLEEFAQKLQDVEVLEKDEAILFVEVSSEKSQVSWHKDGEEIVSSDRIQVVADGRLRRLVILSTNLHDEGEYTCVLGDLETTCELSVRELPAEIVKDMTDQTVNKAEKASFAVELSKGDAVITWFKDGSEIRFSDHYQLSIDGKIQRLLIYNCQNEDAGVYRAVVGKTECSATLKVEGQVEGDFLKKLPPQMDVISTTDAELTVEITKEERDVTWFRNGEEITVDARFIIKKDKNRRSLVIQNVNLDDTAEYSCVLGSLKTSCRVTVLVLESAPSIDRSSITTEFVVNKGTDVTFTVPFKATPQPTATWSHKGKPIDESKRLMPKISENVATFTIYQVQNVDCGEYTLKLVNSCGDVSIDFVLKILDKPSRPGAPEPLKVTDDSVTLHWRAPEDDGGRIIIRYIIEHTFRKETRWVEYRSSEEISETTVTVTRLTKNEEYSFRVAAVNEVGTSEFSEQSEYIKVAEPIKPEAPEVRELLQPVVTGLRQTIVLQCVITGTPMPEITWTKDGKTITSNLTYENYTATYTIKESNSTTSGTYCCRAENSAGSAETKATVVIQESPQFEFDEKSQAQRLVVGDRWHIPIKVTGFPQPKITWTCNDQPIQAFPRVVVHIEEEEGLTDIAIQKVAREDSALFSITAQNTAGRATMSFNLRVDEEEIVEKEIVKERPAAPAGPLEFSEITTSSARISWQQSPDDGGSEITSYYIEKLEKGQKQWQKVAEVEPNIFTYVVQNLNEGREYFFRVFALNAIGLSEALEATETVYIKSPFSPPGPPLGPFDVTDMAETSLVLHWQEPLEDGGSPITSYTVERRTAMKKAWQKIGQTSENVTHFECLNLKKGYTYFFRVFAVNVAGQGPPLQPDEAITAGKKLSVPSKPNGLTVIDVTSKTVTLGWSPPSTTGGADLIGYVIEKRLTESTAAWEKVETVDASVTLYCVENLKEKSEYEFRVFAENPVGLSEEAAVTEYVLLKTHATPPSPPTAPLEARPTGPTSLMIEWGAPESDGGSPLLGYIIAIRDVKRTMWIEVGQVGANFTRLHIKEVQEEHEYNVRVFARNEIGASDPLQTEEPVKIIKPDNFTELPEEDAAPSLSYSTTETLSWMREAGVDADIYSYARGRLLNRDEYFFKVWHQTQQIREESHDESGEK